MESEEFPNFSPIVLICAMLLCIFNLKSIAALMIDSDSPEYNQMYDKLEAEYIAEIKRTTTETTINVAAAAEWKQLEEDLMLDLDEKGMENHYNDLAKPKKIDDVISEETSREIYESKIKRLKCNNPWFWNSIKCTWLEYWNTLHISDRLRQNARVAGIFGGIIMGIIFIPLCSFILTAWFFRARLQKFRRLADYYVDQLTPGVIILPDGTKYNYEPTEEEEEALQDLLQLLTTIV